ncbi:MAG: FecR domain-containing protein [Butyrivibrio sp.]|nr:FecR domain-containing protein [Butyrivibrio sp.]
MSSEKKSKKPIALLAIAAVIVVAIIAVVIINSGKLTASTMRMLRIEGVVKLFEQEKEKTITDNLRLNAGNVLNTADASLAGIALDDTKIVTINELSNAKFDKKGKKLDINLTDGSLFFEVTKKLDADETFDIRTSTMVVGIRGTSGYVATDKNGNDVVVITDGEVVVTGTNPVTGETKTITVKAGEMVTTYLYNDRTVDSIMFEKDDLKEEDLDLFIVKRLAENERLITLVCEDTGWSREKILGIADGSIDSNTMYADASGDGTGAESSGDGSGSDGSAGGNGGNAAASAVGNDGGNGDASVAGNGDGNGDADPNSAGNDGGNAVDSAGSNDGARAASAGAASSQDTATASTASKSGVASQVVSVDSNGVMHLANGTTFDPGYYATNNPDVVSEIGSDPYKLLEHYLAFGSSDKRYGTAAQQQQAEAAKQAEYQEFMTAIDRANAEAAAQAAKEAAASSDGGGSSSGSSGRYTVVGGTDGVPTNTGTAGGP